MAIHIRNLTCQVSVKKAGRGSSLHREEGPARPSMAFAQPAPEPVADTPPPESSQGVQGEQAGNIPEKPRVSPKDADPRQVANRVYDLMRDELALMRQRTRPW